MDCFSGSGGFLYMADKLNRRWIGIDTSSEAIKTTFNRFDKDENLFSDKKISKLIL